MLEKQKLKYLLGALVIFNTFICADEYRSPAMEAKLRELREASEISRRQTIEAIKTSPNYMSDAIRAKHINERCKFLDQEKSIAFTANIALQKTYILNALIRDQGMNNENAHTLINNVLNNEKKYALLDKNKSCDSDEKEYVHSLHEQLADFYSIEKN